MRARASLKSHPIHPMLVVFPLGLWISGFLFDLLGVGLDRPALWATGYYCLIGGAIGAALAAIPGTIDLFTVVPPRSSGRRRGYMHGGLNALALLLFLYIVLRRGGTLMPPDTVTLWLEALGMGGVLVSGWLGATLVYRNQIAVDHRYANAGKWKERSVEHWDKPALNQGELSEGQMMLAHVAAEQIVLGRCSDGVAAFSNHCTHRGGPLADGALVGCTVQCPWHGSQFDVHTGRVVAGPAHRKIETYDTEVRAGEVYIQEPVEEHELRPGKEAAD